MFNVKQRKAFKFLWTEPVKLNSPLHAYTAARRFYYNHCLTSSRMYTWLRAGIMESDNIVSRCRMKYDNKVCNEIIDGSLQCSIVTELHCLICCTHISSLWEKERSWEVWTMPSGAALIFRTVICNHILQRCRGFSWSLHSIIVCVHLFKCLHICEQMISPFEAWLLTWVLAQYRGISEQKIDKYCLKMDGFYGETKTWHLLYAQIKDTTGQCWLQCPLLSYVHRKTAKVV